MHQLEEAAARLSRRHVDDGRHDERRSVAGQTRRRAARIADNADDLTLPARDTNVAADQVLTLVVPAREFVVDDGYRRGIRPIGAGEGAPLADRQSQCLDVAGRDVAHVRHPARIVWRQTLDAPERQVQQPGIRQPECHPGSLNAGRRADALESVGEQLVHLRGILVPFVLQRNGRRGHAGRIEPRAQAAQMHEGAHEEARADEQHDAHRHFADDQEAPRAPAPATGHSARARFRERRVDVHAARVQRGHESEEQAGHEGGEQRDRQHRPIELHGIAHGKHGRAQLDEGAQSAPADDETERAAAEREQRALNQELPDDGTPPASERHARGNLPRARSRSREQQTGDVHAGNEQHQANRAPQHEERIPDVGNLLPLQRQEHTRYQDVVFEPDPRGGGAKLVHFRVSLIPRDVRPQARDETVVRVSALAGRRRLEGRP